MLKKMLNVDWFFFLGICYFLCLKIGSMDLFLYFLERGGISVVGRSVYSSLLKMGFSGGMVLALFLTVKALLTFGVEPNMMMPSGSGGASTTAQVADLSRCFLAEPNKGCNSIE